MSNIIKSPFVEFSEQIKKIEAINLDNKNIINRRPTSEVHEDATSDGAEGSHDAFERSLHNAKQQSDALIEDARKEVAEILQAAQLEAQQLIKDAKDQGYQEGYKNGKQQALSEVAGLKSELQEEITRFEMERQNLSTELAPKIAQVVIQLVENMIGIQEFEKQTIMMLIQKGLMEVDIDDEIVIRVSPDDYDYVMEHEDELMKYKGKIEIDIIRDGKLEKNDCIIETSLGSIDCSLNQRMQGLIRELQLIQRSLESDIDA